MQREEHGDWLNFGLEAESGTSGIRITRKLIGNGEISGPIPDLLNLLHSAF